MICRRCGFPVEGRDEVFGDDVSGYAHDTVRCVELLKSKLDREVKRADGEYQRAEAYKLRAKELDESRLELLKVKDALGIDPAMAADRFFAMKVQRDEAVSRLSSCELQRDEWKKYADAGLSSYAELQAEVARLSSRLDTCEKALRRSMTALDDWINLFADEFCDARRVAEARVRVERDGGTLYYVAVVQEQNRAALDSCRREAEPPPVPLPDGLSPQGEPSAPSAGPGEAANLERPAPTTSVVERPVSIGPFVDNPNPGPPLTISAHEHKWTEVAREVFKCDDCGKIRERV